MAEDSYYAEIIERILAQRRRNREHVASRLEHLQRLKVAVTSLAGLCSSLPREVAALQEDMRRLGEELQALTVHIDGCIQAVHLLNARFRRETLKIAVIGEPRVGKSRLLRTLTGLSAKLIPDQDRLPCTGVRSDIYHKPGTKIRGTVFFHSEATFQEILQLYWQALKLPSSPPTTLRQFLTRELPTVPPEAQSASAQARLEHLQDYRTHLPEFQEAIRDASLDIS